MSDHLGKSPVRKSLWENAKPIIDSLSGIAVIGTLIFIALQWNEMKVGSIDTHNLAVAAHDQASAAHDQAKTSAGQLREMEQALQRQDNLIKQVKSQAKSANSLAASSRRSADAAWEAIRDAQQEDRPWLGFARFSPSTPSAGQKLHVDAYLQNTGKSPAEMLSTAIWTGLHVGEIYEFSDIELPAITSHLMESRAVLVPGQGYTPNGPENKLTIADIQRIQEGMVSLYAVGVSSYRGTDKPNSAEHQTSTCYVWLVKQKRWALCPFMNDAD